MRTPLLRLSPRAAGMVSLLTVAGVAHFRKPHFFDSIVPPGVTRLAELVNVEHLGQPRNVTHLSGVAEIVCAGLIAAPQTRTVGGYATAVLMVAVFPANMYTVTRFWHKPRHRAIALARLPLQIPLITASWKIAHGR